MVETLASWVGDPSGGYFDWGSAGVAVAEDGMIWARGLDYGTLLGVDGLGEKAGGFRIGLRFGCREPEPWPVPREAITGVESLLADPEIRSFGGGRNWSIAVTEPDGTAWVEPSRGFEAPALAARVVRPAFATLPGLRHPIGCAVRVGDDLYFIERRGTAWVMRIGRDGLCDRYAGGLRGYRDGPAAEARFAELVAIVADHDGGLLVADRGNHAIRRIAPDGVVSTVAGTGEPGYVDGPGEVARFDAPTGLVLAPGGDLLVTDKHNHALRVVRRAAAGPAEVVRRPATPRLVAPPELIGRRLDAILASSGGIELALEGARATVALTDHHGIITILRDGEAHAYVDPAQALGARVREVDVALYGAGLPVLRALRFDNGVSLRLGADMGSPVLLPARWWVPAGRPWSLDAPVVDPRYSLPGRLVRLVRRTGAKVALTFGADARGLATPAGTPVPAMARWGDGIASGAPGTWSRLAGRVVVGVGLRYAIGGDGHPVRVDFRMDDEQDLAFEEPSGIRLVLP